jgi:hypothetical protein
MESSRRVGTNEDIKTFGSAGFGRDYTTFSTWEADTDIDCVTGTISPVLEGYKDAVSYSDYCPLGGATCNSTYFRIIRPANGQKHTGTPNSGFQIETVNSAANYHIQILENYSSVQDIYLIGSWDTTSGAHSIYLRGNQTDAVGCISKCTNAQGEANSFYCLVAGGTYTISFINCIAYECTTEAFAFNMNSTSTSKALNCSAIDSTYGFRDIGSGSSQCYGCGSKGCGTAFSNIDTNVDYSSSSPTFVDAANDNYHLASGDTVWKDADTNSGSWHSTCGYDDDIDKQARTGAWDIGADEYVSASIQPTTTLGTTPTATLGTTPTVTTGG